MSVHAIARPYAKALYMLAKEQNEVKAWSHWLEFVSELGRNPLTIEMLKNPVYTKQFRLDFYLGLTKEVMPGLSIINQVRAFLFVLNDLNRMVFLPEIEKSFEEIRRVAESTIKVEITSAKKLTAEEQARFVTALSKRFSSSVELVIKEDPSLMAGAIIRSADIVLDGSVQGKIRQLREALAQ
jgi:F-type H+-transporting ATPase subunit delta